MILRLPVAVFVFFCGMLQAQTKMPAITRHDLSHIDKVWQKEGKDAFDKLAADFPVYKMNGKYVISMIAKVNAGFDAGLLAAHEIAIGSRIGDIVTLKLPLDKINVIGSIPGMDVLEMAQKVQPHLNRALGDVRADSVHMGINLPQSYTGKNVYIGVADWGFDYTHPMYYDTAMTQTRIVAAWDQFKQSGPSPAGFSYGTEYATSSALLAAGSDTANIYSYGYHGGHVAGIAGGGGAGTEFRGVAFESEFLLTTFLIDAGAVLDAYDWMYGKAAAAGKRLVINQSWGLHYMGNLDGTSLLSQAIDDYSDLGVVFASSGGNNGDVKFHLKKTFNNDTLRSKVDFYSYTANPNMWGQSITLWGQPSKSFSVGIKVLDNISVFKIASPFYSTSTPNYIEDILVIGTDTIFYNLSAEAANPLNQRPHIRFRIKNRNVSYKIILQVAAADGTVHGWNVTELTNGVGNWGMPFSQAGAETVAGDVNYGIGEPSCTESVISVAAHSSTYKLVSGGFTGGAIAGFSSFGPTLDDRMKPDISAPGVSVASAVSSFTDNSFVTARTITFNGQDYKFTRISGTSMSSPVVTGVVALLLEANPLLSPYQVKKIIKETARTDSYTGVIPEEGSLRWGAGKINAYDAIKQALNTVSVDKIENEVAVRAFPNPTSGMLYFQGDLNGSETYELFSLDGKMLQRGDLDVPSVDLSRFKTGMYLMLVHTVKGSKLVQVVKESL